MATEDILIRYRADVSQLEADINKVIKQQDELIKATNENTTATNKAVTSQQLAAKKRAELLELEVQKLKKIQEAQKLAFDPKQIQAYNNQIAESTKRIELLEGKSQEAANNITNAFKGAAAALAAAFSVQAISSFAQQSVNAFLSAEEASSRLKSNIVTLGGEGEAAFEAINKQADELAKKTLFDDENIRDAASQLSAFGFSAEEIQKVIPGILDFAQAFKVDLSTAINQVGPALDGVAGKLSKYGLNVSESASRTENLNSVLQFTAQYAGQAEEATKTLAGQLTQKKKEIEELQESIGEKLVPAYLALGKAQLGIVGFFERLSTVIAENSGFFKALIPILITYLGVVTRAAQITAAKAIADRAEGVAMAFKNLQVRISTTLTNINTAATSKNTVATKAQAIATEVAAVAQKGLNAAIKANPLGLLLGVLTTVVLLYQEFADSADEVSEATKKQKENVEELNSISKDYNKQLAVEKGELDRLFNSVKQYNTGSKERQALINEINQKYGLTLQNLDDEKKFVDQLKTAYQALLPTIEAKFRLEAGEARFKKAIEQQFDAATALADAEKERAKALEEVDKAQKKETASFKARQGVSQSALGTTGTLAADANFAQQRQDINDKFNIERLKADKAAADKILEEQRNLYTGLQTSAEVAGKNLNKTNQQLNADRNKDNKKSADEAAKIEADRQKAIADSFAKYADEFLKLRNDADQALQDIEFTITLNTKGLAPAIEQFQKTASEELAAGIQQLQTQIDANPLAFDALTDKQKQALIINQFKAFAGQIDQLWSSNGVSIEDTSANIAASLGPEFFALPFEEAIKKLPELAAKYLPKFKGQFKDTTEEVKTDADKLADAQKQAAEKYEQSWFGANEAILEDFLKTFSELNKLFQAATDARLKQLNEQTEAELEALSTREDANKEQFDNRAISEQEFLEEQTRIANERVAIQEEAAAKEREIKSQQFVAEQAIAIFQIGLATAEALAKIQAQIAVYQAGLPVTAPLLANAQLSRGLLLVQSAAQVAAVLAQPKPYRLGSKDTGPQDHMARVGEEGEEIVFMPNGSKVLPARQTRKYGEVLDAMFDNKLDKYVLDKYVTPALIAQKQRYESEKGRSFADNLAKSIYFNGGINANEMDRIRKKGQPITNVEEIATAIARKLPIRDIYR